MTKKSKQVIALGQVECECTIKYVIKDDVAYMLDFEVSAPGFEGPLDQLSWELEQQGFKGEVLYEDPPEDDDDD